MLEKIYNSSKGEQVDLEKASLEEIQSLHIEEETFLAKEIKKLSPFSKEKNQYLKEAYQKVFQIADWEKEKEEGKPEQGNGVNSYTIQILKNMIERELKKKGRIFLYEAGVGKGVALETINKEGLVIEGCDIFLSEEAKQLARENTNITLTENNLYDALDSINDGSVDVFYADNILEHITEDEYEETCKKIVKKIKRGGLFICIIPNSYIGPADVSKKILPMGTKARGFHFMEQTYQESMKRFKKYHMKTKYLVWRDKYNNLHICKNYFFMDWLKIKMEAYYGSIKEEKLRSKRIRKLGYQIYILERKK